MEVSSPIRFATLPSSAFMMAAIAGFSDVVGFVGANKLFTAHITGNIVIAIAELIHHMPGVASKLIAIPLFLIIAIFVTAWIELHGQTKRLLATWLLLEALLLAGFMFAGLTILPYESVSSVLYTCSALLAVCAMSIHNAVLRTFMTPFPPCTVMTGNLTQLVIDLVNYAWGWKKPFPTAERIQSQAAIKRYSNVFIGFLAGGLIAAFGYTLYSFWIVLVPILLLIFMAIRSLKT